MDRGSQGTSDPGGSRPARWRMAAVVLACALAAPVIVGPAPAALAADPTATPSSSPSPSGAPTPTPTPAATTSPTPSASHGPSATASPSGSPAPSSSPSPTPTATPKPPRLPRCTYEDELTRDRGPDDWATTFLDTIYRLPTTYAPKDLVRTGVAGGGSVRRLVAADLRTMARAAAAAGSPIQVVSAYRSYVTQISDFGHWVRISGLPAALLGSARPGHSEHQLGTTIDVTSLGGGLPWLMWDWGTTAAGRWMRLNAWRYGFVMSYPPKGSPARTCYRYEPWHFRYVGKPTAAAVRASGLTLREYLWRERSR